MSKMSRSTTIPNPQLLSLLIYIVLISCFSTFLAQELPYTSGPSRSYTFTSPPSPSLFFNNTKFEWAASRGTHSGLAYFDGVNDSVNLFSYPDDNGLYFPPQVGQRSFSIEVWAEFLDMQSSARLFETSTVYGAGDNIIIMCVGTTGDLGVRVFSGADQYGTETGRIITPSSWQHVVFVGDQISLSDSTSLTAANYTVYVNAVPVANYVGPLPRDVYRGIANIGKSSTISTTDNLYYRGWIDALHWYNYQLQDQQVAAHFVCKRPPIFDIAFAENPSQITGIRSPNYGFVLTDPDDVTAGIANYRKGLLTFDGSVQYIDLTTNSGSNSIGSTVPTLGGNGFGTINNFNQYPNGYAIGWTFECLVKFTQTSTSGRVYDFSDGGANDIYLGFTSTSSLTFSIANNSVSSTVVVLDSVATNTWYHIIVTITRRMNRNRATDSLSAFVDGAFVRSAPGVFPAQTARSTAYLARSTTGTYLGMKLDSMRIFDFALDNNTISLLYVTTHSPLPTPSVNATSDDMYSTSPVAIYGFDNPMYSNESSFSWLNTSGSIGGIAIFQGRWNSFVDLSVFPDDYGRIFPLAFGGAMSFEAHVDVSYLGSWSKVFDIGGSLGSNDNNIFLAVQSTTTNIAFNIYSGSNNDALVASNGWTPGKWQHIVCTIEQVDFNNPFSSTAALAKIYINGVLASSDYRYLPQTVNRPNAFLARSNSFADSRFWGMMDFFAFYRYTLSPQQVAAHACVHEPPRFEAAFNSDPRLTMTGTTTGYTYTYLDSDPNGSTGTFTHTGLLAFAQSQYVDLTTYQGNTGIGTILPQIGNSSGIGSSIGLSFEILVSFRGLDSGAVFDFGVGTADRILLALSGTTLSFSISNSITGTTASIPVISTVTINTWYHIIIIVTPNTDVVSGALYSVYLNGNFDSGIDSGVYPITVNRTVAYLGRNQDGGYINMLLDAFRIYDYAITSDMANCLFTVTNDEPSQPIETPVYITNPVNLWGFENPYPDATQAVYQNQNDIDGRYGIAYFDGLTSFANLNAYPDSYGNSIATTLGGPLTFQTWLRFTTITETMRVFDFSNNVDANSMNLVVGSGNSLIFTVYGSDSTPYTISSPANTIPGANTWFHVCITISQNRLSDSVSATSATVIFYINAVQIASALIQLPQVVIRGDDYLGRGIATTSARFNGYIDSFALYNYAVQLESLKVHYVSARLPRFELDFALDPRILVNLTTGAGYSWMATDAIASKHTGIIALNRANVQYLNLRSIYGSNTIGVIVPDLGGHFGTATDWTAGFSIQICFQVRTASTATLAWLGNDGSIFNNQIKLLLTDGGSTLSLSVSTIYGASISTLVLTTGITPGNWYYVVVTMVPNRNFVRSTWTAFINGRVTATANNYVFPQNAVRNIAYLGGNTTADAFDGYIDSFRIFDDALSLDSIQNMYGLTADLASSGFVNLGCGYYGSVPSGSVLMSFLINGDIQSFDSTFGANIENAVRRSLGLRAGSVSCQSAVGTDNRISLEAVPSTGQTLVRMYIFTEFRQTAPAVLLGLFQTLVNNGSVTQFLTTYGLPTIAPNSVTQVATCPDGTFGEFGDCGSTSGGGSTLSGGAIAGIVIAVIVGVILLIFAALYFRRHSGSLKGFSFSSRKPDGKWSTQVDDDTTSEPVDEGDIEMNAVNAQSD